MGERMRFTGTSVSRAPGSLGVFLPVRPRVSRLPPVSFYRYGRGFVSKVT
jgi:hypothetical protein